MAQLYGNDAVKKVKVQKGKDIKTPKDKKDRDYSCIPKAKKFAESAFQSQKNCWKSA